MRIGFNLLPYSPGLHGGAEVYLRNLILALGNQGRDSDNNIILFGDGGTISEQYFGESFLGKVRVPIPRGASRICRSLIEQWLLPILCRKYRLDCIVSNYVSPVLAPCAKITIVHDMLYRRYPEAFEPMKLLYWKVMIPASIRRSAAVVTVSNFSAQEMSTFFPETKGKLFVTVEGVRPSLIDPLPERGSVGAPSGPYLLCVATFGKHKNLDMLVNVLAELPETMNNIAVVFVGAARTQDAKAYRASLESLINQLGLNSRVIFTDHVSDAQLTALYRGALALVLPSLYEGFGLPIIEAQQQGCPVLCSNVASMPEIAGEAALMFNPRSVNSIRDAIVSLVTHPELVERLRTLGYENVKRFSWGKAAAQLMTAIEFALRLRGR